MRFEEAIEAFGCGFTFTRSFTHPFAFERFGPLWVMRDTPRKKTDYRTEEWLVYGTPAAEANEIILKHFRDRYAVCVFRGLRESERELKESWKALGYRLGHTEGFFTNPLSAIPVADCKYRIERVTEQASADLLAKAAGRRQILPHHLTETPPRLRQYIALDAGEAVGWVRSITCGQAAWCSNMHVKATHRRRGIGKALMAQMLADDKAAGLTANVLLASSAGAKLYPVVGYEHIGQLSVFTPVRK